MNWFPKMYLLNIQAWKSKDISTGKKNSTGIWPLLRLRIIAKWQNEQKTMDLPRTIGTQHSKIQTRVCINDAKFLSLLLSHPGPRKLKSPKISAVHDIHVHIIGKEKVFEIWIWCFKRYFYLIENLTKWSECTPSVNLFYYWSQLKINFSSKFLSRGFNISFFIFLTLFSFQWWCGFCGRRKKLDLLFSLRTRVESLLFYML